MILAVKDIGISFGALKAVDGVSFSVDEGQIFTVIGPNGAGKTTLFNVISGVYVASRGSVELSGEDVTSLAPDALAARGMSRTFQNLQIFQRMTVAQNVMVGRHLKERRNLFADLLRLPSVGRQNRETRAAALQLLYHDLGGKDADWVSKYTRIPHNAAGSTIGLGLGFGRGLVNRKRKRHPQRFAHRLRHLG